MTDPASRIFASSLRVRPYENVLVLADSVPAFAAVASRIAEAGRGLARVRLAVYPETGRNGVEPAEPAWLAAFGRTAVSEMKARGILAPVLAKRATPIQLAVAREIVLRNRRDVPSAVILVNKWSATHTRLRLLLNAAGSRVVSMPGFAAPMFATAMRVDSRRMTERTRRGAALLSRAETVRVTGPAGTDITLRVKGRPAHADTGMPGPGEFSNLPAGEIYVAPVEGKAEGVIVSGRGPMGACRPPVVFTVRAGRAVRTTAPKYARLFRANPSFGVLAEFGVGTNDRAIVESDMLEAEKVLGTVHFAFGDNSTFGGENRAAFHQDFLVFSPTVVVIRGTWSRVLLDRGKFKA
jgi:leucyl aminopeptidase (aminopeptidase T)